MTITFARAGPVLAPEQLARFEATLPGPLPTDYRAFLVAQNGGIPETNWFPPEVDGGGFGVVAFLSLGAVETYLSLASTRQTFTGRIPGNLLSVAYDDGDAQICLSLTGDDQGSVWIYEPGLEVDPGELPHPQMLVRLSQSFTDFSEALEPVPAPEEMDRRLVALESADTV